MLYDVVVFSFQPTNNTSNMTSRYPRIASNTPPPNMYLKNSLKKSPSRLLSDLSVNANQTMIASTKFSNRSGMDREAQA